MLHSRCHFGNTRKGGMSNTHSFRLFLSPHLLAYPLLSPAYPVDSNYGKSTATRRQQDGNDTATKWDIRMVSLRFYRHIVILVCTPEHL